MVEKEDGQKVDARDVKNGSGGKKGHRAVNNRLKDVDGCGFGSVGGRNNECFEDVMSEVMKRSAEDDFLLNERKKERMDKERMETNLLLRKGEVFVRSKNKEIIDVNKDDELNDKMN